MDGTLRVWDYKTNTLLSKRVFNALFSCAAYSDGVLYVGSTLGYLRIFEFDEKHQPSLIFCQRLRKSAITNIKIGGHNSSVVAVSFSDKHVGFLHVTHKKLMLSNTAENDDIVDYGSSVDDEDSYLSLLGFCMFSDGIATLAWATENGLYVATDVGDLYMIEPPTHFEDVILLNNITKDLWKLDYPSYGLVPFKE